MSLYLPQRCVSMRLLSRLEKWDLPQSLWPQVTLWHPLLCITLCVDTYTHTRARSACTSKSAAHVVNNNPPPHFQSGFIFRMLNRVYLGARQRHKNTLPILHIVLITTQCQHMLQVTNWTDLCNFIRRTLLQSPEGLVLKYEWQSPKMGIPQWLSQILPK